MGLQATDGGCDISMHRRIQQDRFGRVLVGFRYPLLPLQEGEPDFLSSYLSTVLEADPCVRFLTCPKLSLTIRTLIQAAPPANAGCRGYPEVRRSPRRVHSEPQDWMPFSPAKRLERLPGLVTPGTDPLEPSNVPIQVYRIGGRHDVDEEGSPK